MAILSVLDLSPINEGGTVAEALNNSRLLAQHAEHSDTTVVGGRTSQHERYS